jgi:perosamine synthetase
MGRESQKAMSMFATEAKAGAGRETYYNLSRPDVRHEDIEAVLEVLRSPHLALGPKLVAFEKAFAAYIGAKHAVAVNSGTSGLHLAVRALGISDGDEVITTPFSFVASANCMLYERAVPQFVDIDPVKLNMDVSKVEAAITPRTKAILPVHVFGLPCDMGPIMDIAKRRKLAVIEDACEAIGATYKGRKAGTFGAASVFAFYPNKQMTTGEGGIIVTDDDAVADFARSSRNQGRGADGTWLSHVRLGYNYRLDEMSAALGLAQVSRIDSILERRSKVAGWYAEALKGVAGVQTLAEVDWATRSWFVYVVALDRGIDRDEAIKQLETLGVQARAYFPPIHLQPFYRETFGYSEGAFPVCEAISARTLAIPFYNALTREDVMEIADRIRRAVG